MICALCLLLSKGPIAPIYVTNQTASYSNSTVDGALARSERRGPSWFRTVRTALQLLPLQGQSDSQIVRGAGREAGVIDGAGRRALGLEAVHRESGNRTKGHQLLGVSERITDSIEPTAKGSRPHRMVPLAGPTTLHIRSPRQDQERQPRLLLQGGRRWLPLRENYAGGIARVGTVAPITRDFSVYHSRYAGNPPESRIAPVEIAGQSLRGSDSIGSQEDL